MARPDLRADPRRMIAAASNTSSHPFSMNILLKKSTLNGREGPLSILSWTSSAGGITAPSRPFGMVIRFTTSISAAHSLERFSAVNTTRDNCLIIFLADPLVRGEENTLENMPQWTTAVTVRPFK